MSHLKRYQTAPNPIAHRRIWLGLKQSELAARADVTTQTVTELEAGLYRKPPPSLLKALSSSESDATRLGLDYASWVSIKRRDNEYLFREDYNVSSFEEYILKIGKGSIRGFCRALVIQRSLVQGYLNSGGNWETIENCLWHVSLSSDFTSFLKGLPRTAVKGVAA